MTGGTRDRILIRPVTPARILDFELLMRSNAITASCWDIFPRRLNADGAARRKYWTSKGVRAAEGNRRDAVALVRRASIRARSRRGSTMSRSGSFRACTCVVHIATVA